MKQSFGTKIGTCAVCKINCWDASDGKPAIFPCGVKDCPYETAEFQQSIGLKQIFSDTSSGLAQILET
jgi:hypothetical protein|tara:strand:+ start:1674 stop:1877 length:204 start_codon:yes stop_codon:yes gene_type:complete